MVEGESSYYLGHGLESSYTHSGATPRLWQAEQAGRELSHRVLRSWQFLHAVWILRLLFGPRLPYRWLPGDGVGNGAVGGLSSILIDYVIG